MTNPHDHDLHGEEGHAEAWQHEQPPVDDFADHGDEVSVSTEETAATSFDQQESGKKKGRMIVIVAGLIGTLFVGTMAYLQFGGSNAPSIDSSAISAALNMPPLQPTAPAVQPVMTADSSATTPTTDPVDLNAIYNAGQDRATGTAAPTTGAVAKPETPVVASEVMTTTIALPEALPTPTPAAPMPVPSQPVPDVATVAPVSIPTSLPVAAGTFTPPPTVATHTQAGTDVESRLMSLTLQIQTLQKSLEQTAVQTTQLANQLQSGATGSANGALDERLNQLQQQINTLSSQTKPALVTEIHDMSDVTASQPVVRKSVVATKKVMKPSRKKTQAASKPAGKLVLRAATPDSAWVSKGSNTATLQQVRVGDSLPGIGRVKAIREVNGGWAIVGSSGTLR